MNKDVWDDIGRAVTGAADTVSRKASELAGRSGRIMRLWGSWYTIGIQRKAVRRSPSRSSVKRSPVGKS